jgi:hypothetical protein
MLRRVVQTLSLVVLSACHHPQTRSPTHALVHSDNSSSRYYVVASPIWACPDASQFHGKIDGLIKGDPSVSLPEECSKLEIGTVVIEPPGGPPLIQYRGFNLEQATLRGGKTFWSGELHGDSLREASSEQAFGVLR